MKNLFPISLLIFSSFQINSQNPLPLPVQASTQVSGNYTFESIPGDPLNARIYHLKNGLSVYMTVYKDAPRIQTFIATRAGSKNDPSDATGLAHYLEHMLFKGTDRFGSLNYEKEKPELDKIENLYEKYRLVKDEATRKKMYHQIDSISVYASKFAIANEYDKMMSSIGAKGTNAFTDLEMTVYVEDIPSNQLEKWATIESERFRNPVLRLFHTELEAVYEEKNRGLDNDGEKAWEALYNGLFPHNNYGSQTTIGTIEHLKNPSLTKIKQYFNSYYVPNNMAICMSGDFDMDATIKLIDQKFGNWQLKQVPEYIPFPEKPIIGPVVKKVTGPDAESVMLGFRFAGDGSKDADMIRIISKVLSNGKAGLIDLDLNQKQAIIDGYSFDSENKDYSVHILGGTPKDGQQLEDVQKLLLNEIEKVKKGEFSDWLLSAIITDMKLEETKSNEQNWSRGFTMVDAFIKNKSWKENVLKLERLSHITKEDVMKFASLNYNTNYVVVYKKTGEDKNVEKVTKPAITPIETNRNEQSPFVKKIIDGPIKNIEPVFINYEKDIQKFKLTNGVEVLYAQNSENKTFDMYYKTMMGKNNNKKLNIALDYLKYLGTDDMSASQIQEEFYKLGCSFDVNADNEQTWVSLSGLSENFQSAAKIFEHLLANAQPNEEALSNLKGDILKSRADAKLNKSEILYGGLFSYGKYGVRSPYTNVLLNEEIKLLKSDELLKIIHTLTSYDHKILYYGSASLDEVSEYINRFHLIPEKLMPVPPPVQFKNSEPSTNVYVVNYDMKQAEIIMLAQDGVYDQSLRPQIRMFNEYFGGGMSSVVFQEMRESKALAYSVYSSYSIPQKKLDNNFVFSYIGTQADKLPEAMKGMKELINNMPESKNNFEACKEAILQGIRSERITKSSILFNYENALKLGHDHDVRIDIFKQVPAMKLDDVKSFEKNHVQNKTYTTLVLGKKDGLDIKTLQRYGTVSFLSLEEIFGY